MRTDVCLYTQSATLAAAVRMRDRWSSHLVRSRLDSHDAESGDGGVVGVDIRGNAEDDEEEEEGELGSEIESNMHSWLSLL